MEPQQINNVYEAITHALRVLEELEGVESRSPLEGEKGIAGAWIRTKKGNVYCVKFQKSHFRSFNWGEDYAGEYGMHGVCFTSYHLFECVTKEAKPLLVMGDCKMYTYPAKEWIRWCGEHAHLSEKVIYKAANRQVPTDTCTYYNIPIKLVERFA